MAITTALNASSIYGAMARMANRGPEAQTKDALGAVAGAKDPSGFADLIKDQVASVIEQGKASDTAQRDLMAGKADVIDVVTAVSETELALETMVSVRDRVINAYQEIMRMPI
ncbi:flagellar hook-basal body complex protein FliE [Chthonobacter albigriseus]|uniref:flagellar hook-basal body complex protein FliE n=1 Tax=Chthonobacter albigriseus TaxID=1683161 RepID=UPI0015EE94B0|nr:flagellar hook-basal body complex protein FliE [Chthonobacter albigriseus]